jgi:DNA-binding NtrC family response regulator
MPSRKLSASDAVLFSLVARAVLANPFGKEREEIDARLAGRARGSPEETLEAALRRVAARVRDLEASGRARLDACDERDRALLERVLLFDVFYRHGEDFGRLIQRQLDAGDSPCPVPFATAAIGLLARRGFPAATAVRYFGLIYQLRRAHHFIARRLVGRSPCMRRLRESLWNNVFTRDLELYERRLLGRMEDFSTLVLGGTGTGKGTAAAAIGRSCFIPFVEGTGRFAESFTNAFVAANLAEFPETLIEAELFGHRKGAFTGAVEAHEGLLARSSPHGAVFLDEIGEVAVPVQVKLLRVIEDRVFFPVGSHEPRRFQGRVIAATNRPLGELRRSGAFRDDFFYRLCSDVIEVPSLARRLEEDPRELDDLIAHAVARMLGEPSPEIVEIVRAAIARGPGRGYSWPGNVRELEQSVRRILLTRGFAGEAPAAAPGLEELVLERVRGGALEAAELLAGYCALLHRRHGTFEEVARRTGLDRRTAKKYVLAGEAAFGAGPRPAY